MKKIVLIIASFLLATSAMAAWPSKEITIIVPFPVGGPTDQLARLIQADMGFQLKTLVIVKNMSGANAGVAAAHMIGEKTDGHTFLLSDLDFVVGQSLSGTHLYNNFTPLTVTTTTPLVFYGANSENIIDRFKAQIKNKSIVNVGYTGATQGWLTQISSPLVMNLIPYKGSPALQIDVIGQHVEYGIAGAGGILPLVNDNKLKPIMVSSQYRIDAYPGVPTAAELGFKGPSATSWWCFWAKNDSDPEINAAFVAAVRNVVDKNIALQEWNNRAYKIVNLNQIETQKFITTEIKKYENLKK
jgi:hypothetical protein